MSPGQRNGLLSIREAAAATGLTPKAVRRRIERGTLSSVLVEDRRRVTFDELVRTGLVGDRPREAGQLAPSAGQPEPGLELRLRALSELVLHHAASMRDLQRRVDRLESALQAGPGAGSATERG